MKMNRRNVLVGLGTVVAGGGAALGTGAFSSVEADRSVSVDVAGDADALVGLDANDNTGLVTNDGDGGRLEINLSSDALGADGVNTEATTRIDPGFTIQNNGSQFVDIDVADVTGGGITVSFEADEATLDGGDDVDLNSNIVRVEDDQSFDVNIIIDTTGVNDTNASIDDDATVAANATDETTDPGGEDGFVSA